MEQKIDNIHYQAECAELLLYRMILRRAKTAGVNTRSYEAIRYS